MNKRRSTGRTAFIPRLAYGCIGVGMGVIPMSFAITACSDNGGSHIDPILPRDGGDTDDAFDASDSSADSGDATISTPDAGDAAGDSDASFSPALDAGADGGESDASLESDASAH